MDNNEKIKVYDLKIILPKIIKRWYLFVTILPFFFILSIVFLRYQTPLYEVSSSLRIGADDGSSADALLNEITPFKSSWYDILDEITVMKSFGLALNTVQREDFKVAYYAYGDIKETRLYKDAPFKVVFDTSNEAICSMVPFDIKVISKEKYFLSASISGKKIYRLESDSILGVGLKDIDGEYRFGEKVKLWKDYGFKIESIDSTWRNTSDVGCYFTFSTNEQLVYDFSSSLSVKSDFDESSIMNLSMNHSTPEIAIEYLNGLMEAYRLKDYNTKLSSITKSLIFLRDQIQKTQSELNDKELIAQKLKDDTKIYDLDAAADKTYQQILALQEAKEKYLLQQKYYQLVIDYIIEHRDLSDLVAPSLMGIDDPMVASIVENLRDTYVEKAQKDFSITGDNPTYTTLTLGQQKTIEIAVENLEQGVKRISFNLESIENQMEDKFTLLKSLPSAELNFLRVKREIDGLNKLLEFLVEREAGLGISAAKVSSNHQVIDYARLLSPFPIAPKRSLIKLVFIFIGLVLSGGIVFFLEFFNQKVTSIQELNINGEKPLGSISFINKENQIFALENPNSLIVENFRSLKHNLDFVIPNKNNCKIIGTTSTISGEGKTFVAANLAGVLALGGKRVLVIGADLRKPKLNDYFCLEEGLGLSEYLVGRVALDRVVQKTKHSFLDVILSGETPPNPAEVIENVKFKELIESLSEEYDYIVLDCPPIGLVADYQVMESFIDVTLYIVKQNYTSLSSLDKFKEYQLKNPHLVMNGIKKSFLDKYGYGYGYGYGNEYGYGYKEENRKNNS